MANELAAAILVEETAGKACKEVANGERAKDKFWVSAYFKPAGAGGNSEQQPSSVHATVEIVQSAINGREVKLKSLEHPSLLVRFVEDDSGDAKLELKWLEVGVKERCQILFPIQQLDSSPKLEELQSRNEFGATQRTRSAEVTSLDVSSQGGLYSIGTVRGEVLVGSTSTGQILRKLMSSDDYKHAHLLETLQTQFFPSSNGEVLLSSSRDMQIRLWSTVDGSNPRTFQIKSQALSKPPASIAMIGSTGRNFLVGAGSTVSLWECGSGEQVHVFKLNNDNGDSSKITHVLSVPFLASTVDHFSSSMERDPREFGTEGITVLAVHDKSKITIWNAFTKEHIATTDQLLGEGSEITSILQNNPDTVLVASNDGQVLLLNIVSFLSSTGSVLLRAQLVPWSISAMTLISPACLAICTSSCPVLVSLPDLQVTAYLTGFDSSAATCIANFERTLYVGGKDGLLYTYYC